MRFSIITVLVAAASTALAIDISEAPACAQTCLTDNAGSSTCDPTATSPTCFCADTNYYNLVANCVASTCSTADVLATLTWYDTTCPT
ncbi:hypothetical protein AOQ84DRAFT_372929 [Glonium stellatum]|uniref:CFEM domain-containing protein n=1 Tax=Glonium stellatum TaxID=574774 RepID=A0A8E2F8P0_9PEZI|nr:hypothetical protein AOQ84DRAFT_372929 [Glonium stellatum]